MQPFSHADQLPADCERWLSLIFQSHGEEIAQRCRRLFLAEPELQKSPETALERVMREEHAPLQRQQEEVAMRACNS